MRLVPMLGLGVANKGDGAINYIIVHLPQYCAGGAKG